MRKAYLWVWITYLTRTVLKGVVTSIAYKKTFPHWKHIPNDDDDDHYYSMVIIFYGFFNILFKFVSKK